MFAHRTSIHPSRDAEAVRRWQQYQQREYDGQRRAGEILRTNQLCNRDNFEAVEHGCDGGQASNREDTGHGR